MLLLDSELSNAQTVVCWRTSDLNLKSASCLGEIVKDSGKQKYTYLAFGREMKCVFLIFNGILPKYLDKPVKI